MQGDCLARQLVVEHRANKDLRFGLLFSAETIDRMTEADVRAEIIDPIITKLGYRFGETNYVDRERPLRWPFGYVGHKSKRDVPIGIADYICGIDGRRGSFALDAKRGGHKITLDDIEQTHSYAAHPEIRAEYFALCNGHTFQIYETFREIADRPILEISNGALETDFYKIESVFKPSSLQRLCSKVYDFSQPLGLGYGSSARLGAGWLSTGDVKYKILGPQSSLFLRQLRAAGLIGELDRGIADLQKLRQPIEGGRIHKDSSGRLVADVKFGSTHDDAAYNIASLDMDELTFTSESPSFEEGVPIVFETQSSRKGISQNAVTPNFTRDLQRSGINYHINFLFRALGTLKNGVFSGQYKATCLLRLSVQMAQIPPFEFSYDGLFQVKVLTQDA